MLGSIWGSGMYGKPHMSQGFYLGVVSVTISSWGNDLSVYIWWLQLNMYYGSYHGAEVGFCSVPCGDSRAREQTRLSTTLPTQYQHEFLF